MYRSNVGDSRAVSSAGRLGAAYWQLWTATAASALGDGLVLVAFPLLALSLTRSPMLVAGVAVAGQLPAVIIAPLAGAIVDRHERRRLATAVEVCRLLVFGGFAVAVASGHDSLPLLYATIVVLGCCEVTFLACTNAALPAIVAEEDLERANGHLGGAELTARAIAGQGLGGVAYALARALPFALDALSFAVSAVLVRSCLPRTKIRWRGTSIRADIAEGFRWFARHRHLRLLAALIASYAFCQGGVLAVLVLYATGPLHIGRAGYGLLMAGGALGALAGSLGSAGIARRFGSFRAAAAGGLLAGCAYLLLAAQVSVVAAVAAIALENAGVAIGNVASMSLRQRMIPQRMFGRVATTFRMALLAAGTLGALAGGVVAATHGLRSAFVAAGTLQLVVIVAITRARSRARAAYRPRREDEVLIDLTVPQESPEIVSNRASGIAAE